MSAINKIQIGTNTYSIGVDGGIKFLGTLQWDNDNMLFYLSYPSDSLVFNAGDFFRIGSQGTLGAETAHVGDIAQIIDSSPAITYETSKSRYEISPDIADNGLDVLHTEIDTNSWTANSRTKAGYVTAGGSNANKFWGTDANGNPAWRSFSGDYLPLSGGTLTGNLYMGGHDVDNVGNLYIEGYIEMDGNSIDNVGSLSMDGSISMNSNDIEDVATLYVDEVLVLSSLDMGGCTISAVGGITAEDSALQSGSKVWTTNGGILDTSSIGSGVYLPLAGGKMTGYITSDMNLSGFKFGTNGCQVRSKGNYLELDSGGNELCLGSTLPNIHINYGQPVGTNSTGTALVAPSVIYWHDGTSTGYADLYVGKLSASKGSYDTSDIRKKNVLGELDLEKAYELIDKCSTIIYELKDDDEHQKQLGLIAQEVKEFFPEIISEDAEGILSLDYARLTVIILRVLKDLIERIKKLEK